MRTAPRRDAALGLHLTEPRRVGGDNDVATQLHLDAEYMKASEYGQVLVNSCFTLSLMVGVSVGDTTLGTAVANLGWDEVRFPKPVFIGDTLNIVTEVLELRESKSRPDAGIVTFRHEAWNQRGELVASCKRSGLQRKQPG